MVLKSALAAAICTGLMALAGPAMSDDYRPSEFLGLDFSVAAPSPKRLGPDAEFTPVRIEAKTDRGLEALARAEPAAESKVTIDNLGVAHAVEEPKHPVRARLARRHAHPLDAQALDTRIQTWPCKSGGICGWHR